MIVRSEFTQQVKVYIFQTAVVDKVPDDLQKIFTANLSVWDAKENIVRSETIYIIYGESKEDEGDSEMIAKHIEIYDRQASLLSVFNLTGRLEKTITTVNYIYDWDKETRNHIQYGTPKTYHFRGECDERR